MDNQPADWPTAQVGRGAAYLDDTYPGWRDKVRATGFVMSCPCCCVLTIAAKGAGGNFYFTFELIEYGVTWCEDHGFLDYPEWLRVNELRAEWRRVLGMEPDDGEF